MSPRDVAVAARHPEHAHPERARAPVAARRESKSPWAVADWAGDLSQTKDRCVVLSEILDARTRARRGRGHQRLRPVELHDCRRDRDGRRGPRREPHSELAVRRERRGDLHPSTRATTSRTARTCPSSTSRRRARATGGDAPSASGGQATTGPSSTRRTVRKTGINGTARDVAVVLWRGLRAVRVAAALLLCHSRLAPGATGAQGMTHLIYAAARLSAASPADSTDAVAGGSIAATVAAAIGAVSRRRPPRVPPDPGSS